MRTLFTLLVLLAFYTQGSMAQRPWIFAYPDTDEFRRLTIVNTILFAFSDQGASYSIDHGRSWERAAEVGANVRAMSDFFSGVSLAVTQGKAQDSAKFYFSSNGTNWTFSESLWFGNRLVNTLTAKGQQFYVGTTGGMIFVRGVSLDSMSVGAASDILDLKVTDTFIAAATTAGVQISTDNGATWNTSNPPQLPSSDVLPEYLFISNGNLLAPSTTGLHQYDLATKAWTAVGVWPDSVTNHHVEAIAGDAQRLLVLVKNDTNHVQMYRLESGDTAWTPTAYPMPHSQPIMHTGMLTLDNGWAVAHHLSATATDSVGLYHYDLNDFSSVNEITNEDGVTVLTTAKGIEITTPWETGFTVTVIDLLGHEVAASTTSGPSLTLPNIPPSAGTYGVVVRSSDGRVAHRLIMR